MIKGFNYYHGDANDEFSEPMGQELKHEGKHLCRLILKLIPLRGDMLRPKPIISMRRKE